MISNNSDQATLKWKFDVNTFRLLGRELITDRITAIYELVKNCYDANATLVDINFNNVSQISKNSTITITDNGLGMSFDDIRNKWMVVGTNSKRASLYSPPPFNRKFVGEKGIGRFAVDKLGEKITIRTKQQNESKWLNVQINWDVYENLSKNSDNQLTLFTEVENQYFFEDGSSDEHGTQLIIKGVSEKWTEYHLERLFKELSKLVSPIYPIDPPFNIRINSNEYNRFNQRDVVLDPVKFYSHFAEIDYDLDKNLQQSLFFNIQTNLLDKRTVAIQNFGPIKLRIYYFNEASKKRYNAAYKNDDTRIDGIKIYRDGVITTPFAEFQQHPDKKRDILGIDKRRWSGSFNKVGTKEIIGILDISKNLNPSIIDSTNRQDFIENDAYSGLKDFIIQQLGAFEQLKEYEREEKKTLVEIKLTRAGKDIKIFEREIQKIEELYSKDIPSIDLNFNNLKEGAKNLHDTISKAIDEQKKFQKEVERKEKVLLSVVSMQEYASLVSHAVRTSISKVKHFAEFIKLNFPNPEYNYLYGKYAEMIFAEMNNLVSVTDFMLSYAASDKDYEEFSIKELITDLLVNKYELVFKTEKIDTKINIKDDFVIETNKKTFQDIFQNLISNSVKALRDADSKVIHCSGFLNNDNYEILFSDNGCGIEERDREWIFGLYNTRTAELGGGGVGLYIVDKLVKALGGTISVIDSEYSPEGATFKIIIPFNN